jgi:uncharacterized NAD-dependent epimerase/dehydratase family protein
MENHLDAQKFGTALQLAATHVEGMSIVTSLHFTYIAQKPALMLKTVLL